MRHDLIALSCYATVALCAPAPTAWGQEQPNQPRLEPHFAVKPAPTGEYEKIKNDLAATGSTQASTLPLWLFRVEASRNHQDYTGVMVGADPFTPEGKKDVSVAAFVVPLIVVTHTIATAVDLTTGQFTVAPGATTMDPTAATACLSPPNNVPASLLEESPIFRPAHFRFGATDVGTAQYVDAFQRGNFWQALGMAGTTDAYHVRLDPVQTVAPVVLEVPAASGLAITDPLLLGPPALCAPFGIIDINWVDDYLAGKVLPALAAQGVSPSNLPLFLLSNVMMSSDVSDYFSCCTHGYHNETGLPIQTYVVSDFDTSGYWLYPIAASVEDSGGVSHEVAEWMNDPFGNNPVPSWGHIGQQGGCQRNLEVGDPLSGTAFPAVVMPNGFTYHLQELAFFSWFFGAPSIGANGWFSDNGTFATDAGPVCQQ